MDATSTTVLAQLAAAMGPGSVISDPTDMARFADDATGGYSGRPLAVLRPGSTSEVAACVRIASAAGVPVVPVSGNTGLVGGTMTRGGLLLSLDRMSRIREIRPEARLAVVEAGVVLDRLHQAAEDQGLYFPLWFGARGSAMIGGVLSTNAGGSNVLRYGSTRGLCLGLEVVLADGRVLNLMSELHKDNSGYDLKDLFIGAEGTLGVITAAVMRLVPAPRAHATATVALDRLAPALTLLNRCQQATGGLVEAFEFMPDTYMRQLQRVRPDLGLPFADIPPVTILIELVATAPRLADPGPDGVVPLSEILETVLAGMMDEGLVRDAVMAASGAQRRAMWARREAAAEITYARKPAIDTDIAVPLDRVESFLERIHARLPALDAGADTLSVAHLGDGNVHFTVFPTREAPDLRDAVVTAIEDVVAELGGSFSAEHGVGLSKRPSMARRKDPVALSVMAAVKAALDPLGQMNPGKILPDAVAKRS